MKEVHLQYVINQTKIPLTTQGYLGLSLKYLLPNSSSSDFIFSQSRLAKQSGIWASKQPAPAPDGWPPPTTRPKRLARAGFSARTSCCPAVRRRTMGREGWQCATTVWLPLGLVYWSSRSSSRILSWTACLENNNRIGDFSAKTRLFLDYQEEKQQQNC